MEFKVIDNKTGKEADPYEIALHEDWAKDLCYCDMEGFAILEDGSLILVDECGRCEYCDSDRFTVVFEQEWIPNTIENLDEVPNDYYLVQDKDGDKHVAYLCGYGWTETRLYDMGEIVAFRKLPKGYKV